MVDAAVLGYVGVLGGWIWPVLFLAGAGVLGLRVVRRPGLVAGMLAITVVLLSVPDGAVGYAGMFWMWTVATVGAAAVLAGARRLRPGGPVLLWHLASLLPRGERDLWRAEVRAVLHACTNETEARRQMRGFLTAVPATVLTSWRTRR